MTEPLGSLLCSNWNAINKAGPEERRLRIGLQNAHSNGASEAEIRDCFKMISLMFPMIAEKQEGDSSRSNDSIQSVFRRSPAPAAGPQDLKSTDSLEKRPEVTR